MDMVIDENDQTEPRRRNKERRLRTRQEIADRALTLGPVAPQFVKDIFSWILKEQNEFPDVMQSLHVNLPVASVHAENVSNFSASQSNSTNFDTHNLDNLLEQVLSNNGRDNSIAHLSNLEAPKGLNPLPSIKQLKQSFTANNYFISDNEVFCVHQALASGQPLIVDGPPGVGKTELAKQIAIAMGLNVDDPNQFGSLFCTPDLSKAESIYEWNDAKRLIDIQLIKDITSKLNFDERLLNVYRDIANNIYSERYLELQTLLRACVVPYRTVVLVDEIDKTYPEFDNYLLDILMNNYFTVPEYGKVGIANRSVNTRPIFVLTTNRERDLSGPLVRRCKPIWFDYLSENLETKVLSAKCNIDEITAGRVANFFYKIRTFQDFHFRRPPSTAEVIETTHAINGCDTADFSPETIFSFNCHWIKDRRDYDAIVKRFCHDGKWADTI